MENETRIPDCCEESCVHCDAVQRVQSRMPDEDITRLAADFFKAFSDKTRLRILTALAVGELCVCDIAELLGMTQSAISHQLALLKRAKLIRPRREGRAVFYSLADGHVRTIIDQGLEHIEEE